LSSSSLAAFVLLGFAALPVCAQELPGSGALPLRAAVEIALANSAQLQAARSALTIAGHQIREAYSGVYPQVSVEASYVRTLAGLEQVVSDGVASQREPQGVDSAWSGSLRLNQTALDFRVFSGLNAAEGLRELRGEELRGAAQLVVDLVRQRYFDALLAQEQVRLLQQSIARLEQTRRETQARHREGFASENELLRLEVQLAGLQAQQLWAGSRVAAARGALLVAMGTDPLQTPELQGTLNELRLDPGAANIPANADLLAVSGADALAGARAGQLQQIAMTNRSDLRQLRALHGLGELQVSIQEAEYLPTIRAFGSVDFSMADEDEDDEFGTPGRSSVGPAEHTQWRVSTSAGLTVQWQLFSGFARDSRAAQRREELRQTTARLRQAERAMLNQVHTLVGSLEAAAARAASRLRAIGQAGESYEIAAARYRAGIGSQLEIFAAETILLEAQVNYAEAVRDYLSSASGLELAIGRVPLAAAAYAAPGR